MNRLRIGIVVAIAFFIATAAWAQDDALGLYFSDTEFSLDTAHAYLTPGFLYVAYIVLTDPTGAVVEGYEVAISCTAADFTIPLTGLSFDQNDGTNTNQIVTFGIPKPVVPGGTVLTSIFFGTASQEPEIISFGPSVPSSLPDGVPVIHYASGPPAACSYPYGLPEVMWLNSEVVPVADAAWGEVKALFR